jgi:mxaJ protein
MSAMTASSALRVVALLVMACIASMQAGAQRDWDKLKVCADPNNLPFSNRNEEGFENKLAAIWAQDLGLELEYTWFPQRRGFERNTLNAIDPATGENRCDVIVGVPDGYDLAMTTRPYYHSTYALVYLTGRGLDLGSGEDLLALPAATRDSLRIGVFTPGPAADWLARHGMHRQIVPYSALDGDPNAYPGQLIENELRAGDLDAAILWGPIAGYFTALAETADVAVLPLRSEAGVQFDFAISAGVRFGDRESLARLERLMTRTAAQIATLLADFHVPLIDDPALIDVADQNAE